MKSLDEQVGDMDVDLDRFDTFVDYAKTILDYVHFDLRTLMEPTEWARLENTDGNPFGNFEEANGMKQSVVESRAATAARISEFEGRIRQIHAGLQEIGTNYRSVEELNRADVDKIAALLKPLPPAAQA
ncbi:MAG TPA: hypothetical protein VK453_01835 [Micromonosporaceae bacterium]|nr:hypothetical protein [Micromonosporaceae bacterium]